MSTVRRVSLNCLALDSERPIGVERFVRNVVSGINLPTSQVTCFTRSNVDDLTRLFKQPFIDHHSHLRQKKISVGSTMSRILIEMFVLPFLTRRDDLVLSVNNFGPLWGKRGQIRLNIIPDVWFMDDGYEGNRLARWVFQILIKIQIFRSTRIITISKFSKQEINKYFNVPLDTIEVVSCCLGERPKIANNIRRMQPPHFLIIGSERKNKNIKRGIKGYCIFRKSNPEIDIKLKVVGKFTNKYIVDAIELYQDYERDIDFKGYVSDAELERLYQESAGIIFPSLYEGFGIPAVEGIARAKPVLVSERTACAEIVGEFSVKVDGKDSQAIATGIKKLMESTIDITSPNFKRFSEQYLDCTRQSKKLSDIISNAS